jgi:two-component system response regulator AlgR
MNADRAAAVPGRLGVLIVDDEPLARLRLRGLVQDLPDPVCTVLGEAGDADEALMQLRSVAADVVLLDIRMPGRDGLRLAAALKSLPQAPAVVFVTAHAEHALKAFELEALDYLTKPVRRDRLAAALQRVQQRVAQRASPKLPTAAEAPVLVLTERGRVLRLPLAELLYFKADQKYVTVRTATHVHVIDDALSDLEQRLGDGFLRVHRNALVALRAIRALELRPGADDEGGTEGWAVRVAPLDEWLAVSRRQVAAVRAAMGAP